MAFLEADAKPLVAGWGPPQQLHAPDIGSTLGAILRNRIAQQQQTQEAISAAIKAQQSRNQDAAYAQALQNAGLTQGQDISGLSGPQATKLADLIQEQTPDTEMDAYHRAATAKEQAMADAIKSGTYGRGRVGGSSDMVDIFDEENDPDHQNPITVSRHSKLYQDYLRNQYQSLRPPPTASATETDLKSLGLTRFDILNSAKQQGYKGGQPLPSDQPWTSADEVRVTPVEPSGGRTMVPLPMDKFRDIKRALGVPDPDPVSPSTTPGANPDVTITPAPSATPIPQGRGADKNLAPGFGKPVSDQDVAALGWARAHPDDPRSAAILQRLGIQ